VGFEHGEKPKFAKVGIRPALMVLAPATPLAFSALAEYTAQAHAYPFVERFEDVADFVALNKMPRLKQVAWVEQLVHQAVPFASFHSRDESSQHASCPDDGFRPHLTGLGRTAACSVYPTAHVGVSRASTAISL
jgi:hypothetical protein